MFSCLLFKFFTIQDVLMTIYDLMIQGQNKCYTNSVKVLAQQTFREEIL